MTTLKQSLYELSPEELSMDELHKLYDEEHETWKRHGMAWHGT